MRFLVDNPVSPQVAATLEEGSLVVLESRRIRIRTLPIGA